MGSLGQQHIRHHSLENTMPHFCRAKSSGR